MDSLGIDMAKSETVHTVEDAERVAKEIGFPVVVRPAYTMGGGSPFDGFDFSSFKGGGGFSSFFENLFGGGAAGFSSNFGGFGRQQAQKVESQASMSIDMYTALLGGEVMVGLSDGQKLRLKVKPGTQPGTKVRLRGKGQGGADLILTYNVTLPTHLTERQKDLLRQMQSA